MKLTKPVQAHGETVTELTFREPTGRDLIEAGFPFKFEGGAQVIDTKSVAEMIARLAAIPPPSVAALNVLDFARATGEVLDFFADPERQSTS